MLRNFYRHVRWPSAEVRRGVIRSTLFTSAMLLVSCRGGLEAENDQGSVSASGRLPQVTLAKPAAVPVAAAPSFVGINVASTTYYTGEHSYLNLLVGTRWVTPGIGGWPAADPSLFDSSGNVLKIPAGGLNKILSPPETLLKGTPATIRCTWTGSGDVRLSGFKDKDVIGDHSYEFRWPDLKDGHIVWLELAASSANNPIRNLDCREKGATGTVFTPEFVASLKPFGVLRFMDWLQTNDNATIRWSGRTLPEDLVQSDGRGVALENIVTLTNQVGADAWVNVPWNADDDYVQRMAQLLHDGIPANRHVYVEVSNEVWNPGFAVQHQAEAEGIAENIAPYEPNDRYKASMLRYAEKTVQVMKIWTKVFADRPGQLVRVAATQHDNPWTSLVVMSYADTANWVDALATAPYFGADLFTGANAGVSDANVLFPALNAKALQSITILGGEAQAVAKKYGKRYIAYEAGQHVLNQDFEPSIAIRLGRDQRMYDVYRAYLAAWKAQFNDTIMLFNSTGTPWGLREYSGQPLDQTPKRRATLDAIAAK